MLRKLIESEKVHTAIIFCNRKTTVRELAKSLQQHGYKAGEIHGDMDQSSRIKELDLFKAGTINILVASDVAARGLDIKGVSHVFNFDAPWHPDDYVHRIGRTGRAGATGSAFTLVTPADEDAIAQIEKLTSHKIERLGKAEAETVEDAKPARGEARPARTPRPPREPRAEREPRTERAPRPEREARPERPARAAKPQPKADDDDGTWNGPLPDFLSVSLNR